MERNVAVAAIAITLVVVVSGTAAIATAGVSGTYSGKVKGASASSITFKVITGSKAGKDPRVRFVSRDIPLVCGSGEVELRSFPATTVKLRSSNLFYRTPFPAEGQDRYGFAGEINDPKEAVEGGVWFDETSEPEGSPSRCATQGTLEWRAKRD